METKVIKNIYNIVNRAIRSRDNGDNFENNKYYSQKHFLELIPHMCNFENDVEFKNYMLSQIITLPTPNRNIIAIFMHMVNIRLNKIFDKNNYNSNFFFENLAPAIISKIISISYNKNVQQIIIDADINELPAIIFNIIYSNIIKNWFQNISTNMIGNENIVMYAIKFLCHKKIFTEYDFNVNVNEREITCFQKTEFFFGIDAKYKKCHKKLVSYMNIYKDSIELEYMYCENNISNFNSPVFKVSPMIKNTFNIGNIIKITLLEKNKNEGDRTVKSINGDHILTKNTISDIPITKKLSQSERKKSFIKIK
jgi:hypothetical protein